MTLKCNSGSQGNKPGTAGLHIAAVNEWRKRMWKGCGVGSEGPDSFLGTLGILEPSSLGDQFISFSLFMESEFLWKCHTCQRDTVLLIPS